MAWHATPKQPMFLLYDGTCRFCTLGSERLVRLARPGVIQRVSSRDEAEMARLPERARAGIDRALQLVSPDGEVASGAEAVGRALATRPLWRLIVWVYWVPGIRQVTDWLYRIVARNRHRIMGRTDACDSGTCPTK
jgi:predicted DCC family thiol-disulfide oxidoreductase YuxK